MTDARALALSVLMPGFTGTTVPAWLRDRVQDGLAGVCLFGQNVDSDQQVRELTADLHAIRPGVLVSADEEGGSVSRLDGAASRWPGHATLGALDDEQATYDVAAGLATQARAAGVDIVLAPVVDVNSEPDNPVIGVRSFGATPDLVARHGAAFVRGLQDHGVAACVKHYPGHGATRTDSHLELPVLDVAEDLWRRRDLAPFAAAVAASARCVMTAHVVVRAVDEEPATMSRRLLAMLREDLGFEGVVVSDALDMRAISAGVGRAAGAVRALAAGVDLLCVGNPVFPDGYDEEAAVDEIVEAVDKAVADGVLPPDRLEQAARRVGRLRGQPPAAPVDRGQQLREGVAVARRAIDVHGDVHIDGPEAVVLVPTPRIAYAAGRTSSALVAALVDRRPGWQVVEVDDAAAAAEAVDESRPTLVVVEGRPDPRNAEVVRAVLRRRPDAVVVYGGLARPDDAGERTMHTYGAGAATALAAVELLLGEGPR
jgi:beta-N-acetylhexosaminidase